MRGGWRPSRCCGPVDALDVNPTVQWRNIVVDGPEPVQVFPGRGARRDLEFLGRQRYLKDESPAICTFHQGTEPRDRRFQQQGAVAREGAFELKTIDAEAAQVRDKRVPPGRI